MPAGTEMPPQEVSSTPFTPSSAKVGTSGSEGLRRAPAIASALSLPAWICGAATDRIGVPNTTCWPRMALTSSEAPL